jgi:hypothetical protein
MMFFCEDLVSVLEPSFEPVLPSFEPALPSFEPVLLSLMQLSSFYCSSWVQPYV